MSKSRFIYLLSLVLWVAVLLVALFIGKASDSEPVIQPNDVPVTQPEEIVLTMTEVEAVPMERDPVRDDIPLDAETQRLLWQACEETGIVYELALAVIWQETDFRNIKGDDGASAGYMQVQQRWHMDRMERLGVTDLTDPYSNFLVGCDYLAELIEKNRGLEWALHAYNGGPSYANKMAKAGKVSQYAKNVLNYMNILTMEEF
jgi:hypothetical protein